MFAAQLDTSVYIGTIVMLVIGFIGLVISVLCYVYFSEEDSRAGGIAAGIIALVITAIITGGGLVLVWFPFGYSYNHYVPISGKVQSATSRFISSGSNSGTDQVFLVVINGKPYKVNDTRAAQLKPGMDVTLLCEKEFQFNGTPGYDCNWGKLGLNNGGK